MSNLYKKLFFTFFVLCVYRLGSYIPTAGINISALESLVNQHRSGVLGFINTLSGGSLGRMSVFALAIMPYITSSIILQLLTMSYEPLSNLKKEGESGRKKIEQYSRYLTIIFAILQSYALSSTLLSMSYNSSVEIVIIDPLLFRFTSVITLTVGTILLIWLAEQISAHGIGNGTSLIIFIGIIVDLPFTTARMFTMLRTGVLSGFSFITIIFGILVLLFVIVFFEKSQRRILVQYPKRQVGNKLYGGNSSYMPLKINTSGVMPLICATTLLLFPVNLISMAGFNNYFSSMTLRYMQHGSPIFIIFYISFIILFSFLCTYHIFNPEDAAENLRKHSAYLPGRRPGSYTANYLNYLLKRLTVIGGIYLSFVSVVPEILFVNYPGSSNLGGTSILIVVTVVIETFTQIQTHLFSHKYSNLINKMKSRGKKI